MCERIDSSTTVVGVLVVRGKMGFWKLVIDDEGPDTVLKVAGEKIEEVEGGGHC